MINDRLDCLRFIAEYLKDPDLMLMKSKLLCGARYLGQHENIQNIFQVQQSLSAMCFLRSHRRLNLAGPRAKLALNK